MGEVEAMRRDMHGIGPSANARSPVIGEEFADKCIEFRFKQSFELLVSGIE